MVHIEDHLQKIYFWEAELFFKISGGIKKWFNEKTFNFLNLHKKYSFLEK